MIIKKIFTNTIAMKTLTIFSLFTLLSLNTMATVRTVSNTPTVAQFTTIQLAIDASANGDTVYVYGSPNAYAGFTILDKKITVIGPGWAPNKSLPLTATINSAVTIRNSAAPGSPDGSELHGLNFTSTINLSRNQIGGDVQVNNLRLIRCAFFNTVSLDLSSSSFLFEGCIFSHSSVFESLIFNASSTYENFLFQNNIFYSLSSNIKIRGLNNSINIRFDHNLFYSNNNGGGGTYNYFNNCRFLTFTNNIFNQVNAGIEVSFSTFSNNITNNQTLNNANAIANATPWDVNNNVNGGGNVANQNPNITDQATVNAGTAAGTANFVIVSGPAKNSGSDGKDMGLLFDATGSLNWNNSRNGRIPRIFSMNITTPTVAPGANLSVTVDARKSN